MFVRVSEDSEESEKNVHTHLTYIRATYTPFVEITHLPYQAAILVLADEERLHTIQHLISPWWFHPDEILEVARVHGRQDPILDTELARKRKET